MPSTPQVKRGPAGPDQLPYGAATQVNKALPTAPTQPKAPAGSAAQSAPTPQPASEMPMQGDITGVDEKLFSPTDRPDEPLTQGSPWGPGANYKKMPAESDEDFLTRVVETMATSEFSTPRTRMMAARRLRGA